MCKRVFHYIKAKWAYLLSVLFIWCIPLLLLSEIVVLAKMHVGIKLTLVGYIVLCVVLFAVKRKITSYIHKQNKTVQIVLSCLYKVAVYGFVLVAVLVVQAFSGKLLRWWLYSGISWIVGLVLYVIDKIKESKNGEAI